MTFEELVELMQTAKAEADVELMQSLAQVRDEYVQAGQAHIATETAWLETPDDGALMTSAQNTWAAVVIARTALTDATEAAEVVRRAALLTAWTEIRSEDIDA